MLPRKAFLAGAAGSRIRQTFRVGESYSMASFPGKEELQHTMGNLASIDFKWYVLLGHNVEQMHC